MANLANPNRLAVLAATTITALGAEAMIASNTAEAGLPTKSSTQVEHVQSMPHERNSGGNKFNDEISNPTTIAVAGLLAYTALIESGLLLHQVHQRRRR